MTYRIPIIHVLDLNGDRVSFLPTHINSQIAQDAFGYYLSYFEGDYQSRIAGADNFLRYSKNLPSSSANLYNGNIRDMYTAIMKDDETPLGTYNYQYQYDQLNRIKAMNSQGLSLSGSTIIPVAGLYETSYSYDRNGNITSLQRWADNGTAKTAMDEFTYDYVEGTNQLAAIHDAVNAGDFTEDLDDQPGQYAALGFAGYSLANETTHNYSYDAIGQLVQDKTEEIENIEWTVTGKVKKIERYAFSEKPDLVFTYDPMGQRITKTVYPKSAPGVIDVAGVEKTYYIRDAQGNVMTVYTLKAEDGETNLYLTERNLYGSSRLGVEQVNEVVASTSSGSITINTAQQRVVGDKRYELSNHLGNVLATVTDRKLPEYNVTESLAYYKPDVVSYSDYSPFGVTWRDGGETGKYGFNGQEKDDEVYNSEGTSYTAEFWQYDSRLGRRWNRDPKPNPSISEYACFANNPIFYSDPYGDTVVYANGTSQETIDKINSLRSSSSLFAKVYDFLDNSEEVFVIELVADDKSTQDFNGKFKAKGSPSVVRESGFPPRVIWDEKSTISLKENNASSTVYEEFFHAYQWLSYDGASPNSFNEYKTGIRTGPEWESEAKFAVGMMLIEERLSGNSVVKPASSILLGGEDFDTYVALKQITNTPSFSEEGHALANVIFFNNNQTITSLQTSTDIKWYYQYLKHQEYNGLGTPYEGNQRQLLPNAYNSLFPNSGPIGPLNEDGTF